MSSPLRARSFRAGRSSRVAVALTALAALAACSDSPAAPAARNASPAAGHSATGVVTSAGTPTPEAARPSASVTSTASATTYTVATCTGTTIALTADEKRTLDLHNGQRRTSGLVPFCVHPALTTAARAHAQDMLARGYFSHTSLNGDTFVTRVQRAGYTAWRALAENIAWGSGSYGAPDAVFANWMKSTGHRANILNANLREIGIGVAAGTFRAYGGARLYTVDFGRR